MTWSHNENWMVTADHGGDIKYWQPNMNNVKHIKAHDVFSSLNNFLFLQEAVRDLSFCPTDTKFASCSDDKKIKIWDFVSCREDSTLAGHGWDVKCVDWHPYNSLVVSGSKDNDVKICITKSEIDFITFGMPNPAKWLPHCMATKTRSWILVGTRMETGSYQPPEINYLNFMI